jgi:hypothetical protein
MMNIEIDFDVYKELTAKRSSEEESYNDVLRDLLGLAPRKTLGKPDHENEQKGWVIKGVFFPLGTEFRALYKGQRYNGKVETKGLVINGKLFNSPSAAAVAITGNPVNGWNFWECRMPGINSWKVINTFRQ